MIYTPPQVAKRWGVKPESVVGLIKAGRLAAFTVSPPTSRRPRWRISEAAVLDFENAKVEPRAPAAKRRRVQATDVTEFYR